MINWVSYRAAGRQSMGHRRQGVESGSTQNLSGSTQNFSGFAPEKNHCYALDNWVRNLKNVTPPNIIMIIHVLLSSKLV